MTFSVNVIYYITKRIVCQVFFWEKFVKSIAALKKNKCYLPHRAAAKEGAVQRYGQTRIIDSVLWRNHISKALPDWKLLRFSVAHRWRMICGANIVFFREICYNIMPIEYPLCGLFARQRPRKSTKTAIASRFYRMQTLLQFAFPPGPGGRCKVFR